MYEILVISTGMGIQYHVLQGLNEYDTGYCGLQYYKATIAVDCIGITFVTSI